MKKNFVISFVGLPVILFAVSVSQPRAELVQHYGSTVDSQGDAATCLSCHDGSIAEGISTCLSATCNFNNLHSHPINKDYPPPITTGKRFYYPVSQIKAAGITLLNGQISCISCHNLANQNPPHLVMNNDKSRLCLTCHVK